MQLDVKEDFGVSEHRYQKGLLVRKEACLNDTLQAKKEVDSELKRLDDAIAKFKGNLVEFREETPKKIGEKESEIFEAPTF